MVGITINPSKDFTTKWNQISNWEEEQWSSPALSELDMKESPTWSQSFYSEELLRASSKITLWKMSTATAPHLIGWGQPMSRGQGGASATCQSYYPTCCSCSRMVQSGFITAHSKTGDHTAAQGYTTWKHLSLHSGIKLKKKGQRMTSDEEGEHERSDRMCLYRCFC